MLVVTDPIASIAPEAFVALLPVRVFTDEEIAHWIRTNPISRSQKSALVEAIVALKGQGPITGLIRTALREMEGLPPVPGDDV
jgi:hypothetical protein